MITRDLHTHTTYSDGKNTPEEMVVAAIQKGMKVIGISDHSYTRFDTSYCIKKEKIEEYIREINALKAKYGQQIKVLCGIEQDIFSGLPQYDFDYVIGSVHYIKIGEDYVPIDSSLQELKAAADKYYDGDMFPVIEEYYRLVGAVAQQTNADIIGHFDLITKYQNVECLFDENDERYVNAWKAAVDKLIAFDIPFEINYGPVFRGYKPVPYPAKTIQDYIVSKGGRFIFSSDSHRAETIGDFNE